MTKIGLLFDMDGVMVLNHHYHIVAYCEWAARYGYEIDEKLFNERLTGKTMYDAIVELSPELLKSGTPEKYEEEKESLYREMYGPHMQPTPGLLTFLDSAKALNIPIACGSNAYMKNINFILDGLPLRRYFSAAVSGTEVAKPKPAPDVYLEAAKRIGVHPSLCVVFEDSLTGIKAAQAAGMKVVGVASSFSHDQLAHTDIIINDFTEIDIFRVQALFDTDNS